jgi:uncharacterized phage protein (TIGR02218 family)
MKTLDSGLAAHIDQVVTTLCWCWKLTRKDGTVRGFTDHDGDVAFAGVTYYAASGFTASQIQSGLGLSVDNLDVTGALSSDYLTDDDLTAGVYDGADIEVWRVNWANTAQRVLMRKGSIGEVKRGKVAFQAEVRGMAQKLTAAVGRAYAYDCDADVGDSRCGINCNAAAFKGNGTVTSAIDARRFSASGLTSFADTWFTGGKLTWVTGANAGLAMEVKRYGKGASAGVFELWQPMPKAVSAGDTFTVTVGCDKTFATCKAKFNNAANFQGFPYIPGNDTTISYPTSTQALDGGSRYGN